MKRTAIIMAGGSGERFYPLSRMQRPKQLLPLVSPDKMMIEEAIERVQDIIAHEDIFIITSTVLQHVMRRLLPQLPPENIIAEPYKRNTAPCLALAAAALCARYAPDYSPETISVAVLTADQYIGGIDTFKAQVEDALSYAEQHPVIVTLGITPTRPETGYGYIEVGDTNDSPFARVERFREKPNADTAQDFLDAGNFLWNSGMFFYRCDTFINGMVEHEPDIGSLIPKMANALIHEVHVAIDGASDAIDETFKNFPDISIDYALMERADNITVLQSKFEWDDVGSWDSLDRTNNHDEEGNVSLGDTTIIDTSNSILANYTKERELMLSVVGLEDIIVIATDDAVVVCPKSRSQDVKKIVASLRKKGLDKWL
ncbi:MAG: mannose-1-phosphate guanylyltransferase [Candidatus Kapabacteria bacterium]|nr:mannose-1-phosphate guanylyltransferase [Candidatus Kapabacteria bacterium]